MAGVFADNARPRQEEHIMGCIPCKNLSAEKKKYSNLSALLPLWRDDSKSPAMIKHLLDIAKDVVTYLNHGQTPVVAFDQPLLVLAKRIQWHHQYTYGGFVLMMGPLHTDMAFMSAIGDLLKDSGWSSVLTNAQVVHPGLWT